MAEPAQFSKGMEVEVFSDKKDLRGVLLVATVRSVSTKKKKVLIKYQTLMADETGSKPLREFVNIRPIPPREVDCRFNFIDEVNSYHNDGWWEGVVTRVIQKGKDSRYFVYFRAGKEEIEFGEGELRIHRVWVRGVWVPPMVSVVDLTEIDDQHDFDLNQSSGSSTTRQRAKLPYPKHSTPPSQVEIVLCIL